MTGPIGPVFISYARKDGVQLADRLRQDLSAEGIAVWMDTTNIEGGQDWSRRIEQAIESTPVVIALMTEGAFVSDMCRAEHLRSLRKRRRVIPLLAQAGADRPVYFEHLNYLDFSDAASYPGSFGRLRRVIDSAEPIPAVPDRLRQTRITVPPLPLNVVARPDDQAAVQALLLADADHGSVTGVRGMGGSGKTVLAQALCHHDLVQAAFPDGIAWVALGRRPGDLVASVRAAGVALGDDPAYYATLDDASGRLRGFMADKAALVVLDDVWDARHVEPFRVSARRCRLLFTTRDARIAAGLGSREYVLGPLTPALGRTVLAKWASIEPDALPPEAAALIRSSGALPLALAMIGAMVRGKPHRWHGVVEMLRRAELDRIAQVLPSYAHADLLRALQVSVDELTPDLRRRYLELAVFPEDRAIPGAAAAVLWGTSGADADDIVDAFIDLSLGTRDERGWMSLHALQRDYVVSRWSAAELVELHKRLVDAYRNPATGRLTASTADEYSFTWLPFHVKAAGLSDEWRGLLLDVEWLAAKITATDVVAVIADYADAADDGVLTTVREALTLSAHVLVRDPLQLVSQLHGRLLGSHSPEIQRLVARIEQFRGAAWLRSLVPALPQASGPLVLTLLGHRDRVLCVAVSPDGKTAASAGADRTVNVWDLDSGRIRWTLAGHAAEVNALVILPDGVRAVSGASDGEIRVWDLEGGESLHDALGNWGEITGLAATGDGFVSCSADRTVRLWQIAAEGGMRNSILVSFPQERRIDTVAVHIATARLLVASSPAVHHVGDIAEALRLYDLHDRRQLRTLGHADPMRLCRTAAFAAGGRRAVTGGARGVILWDLESGREELTFDRHGGQDVVGAAVLPGDKTVVTAGLDGALKFWSLESGALERTLPAHTDFATGVAVAADGRRAVSCSWDKTVRVWDLERADVERFARHTAAVTAVAACRTNRRVYSASHDGTVKVWSLDHCAEVDAWLAHDGWILDMAVTPDGHRMLTGSSDGTAQLWDLDAKVALFMLPHPDRWLRNLSDESTFVEPVALAANGDFAVTGFVRGTSIVRVSDFTKPGPLIMRPRVDREWELSATAIHLMPGTRHAVIASRTRGCGVWDLGTGEMVRSIRQGAANATAVTGDETRAFIADGGSRITINRTDGGAQVGVIDAPGPVSALALSADDRFLAIGFGSADGPARGLGGGGLRLWDVGRERAAATFSTDSAIRCCLVADRGGRPVVIGGDASGRVYFLELIA